MTGLTENMKTAASRLDEAAASKIPTEPVRELFKRHDVAAAYVVQEELSRLRQARGARIVGRKIGLTSLAVQQQLGVDQPDFGVLFDDMEFFGGDTIPIGSLLQPKVEAEIAFVLAQDLDSDDFNVNEARDAIDYAVAALEIVDSRIAKWDIDIVDTVADNASSGLYVLGPRRRSLEEFEPKDVVMSMTIGGEVVSNGNGVACLGDPLEALVWLARTAREFGEPLRAGQLVLSGALGPMVTVSPGDEVRAEIGTLGNVSVRFSNGKES